MKSRFMIMKCGKSRFKIAASIVAGHYAKHYARRYDENYADNAAAAIHDNTVLKEWLNEDMSLNDINGCLDVLEGQLKDVRLPCDDIQIVEEEEPSLPPAVR